MSDSVTHARRPEWLKVRLPQAGAFRTTRHLIRSNRLNTVCEAARCPNISECWGAGTATFLILGDRCTRACRFCAVAAGRPAPPDAEEPERVAEAVEAMKLHHAVVTSVTRDDLKDGGASVFAATARAIHRRCPGVTLELLIPDFLGSREALDLVLDERPDVLNHNVETVPRLYPTTRPQAIYRRSLKLLDQAKDRGFATKSSLMVGLGEAEQEALGVLRDLRGVGCDIVTIGQYLQPTKAHLPVQRWVTPDEFRRYGEAARTLGFRHCESGPLVRSSYHAERAAGTDSPGSSRRPSDGSVRPGP